MGDETMHWEGFGDIPPQGGLQADRKATTEESWWEISASPSGRGDGLGGVTGGGDLRLLPPKHSLKFHCYQDHCLPVSGGVEVTGVTDIQAVVVSGRP